MGGGGGGGGGGGVGGGGVDPPILKCRGRVELVVGLWTLKMVYRVPTRYLLIQLQPINHFFK